MASFEEEIFRDKKENKRFDLKSKNEEKIQSDEEDENSEISRSMKISMKNRIKEISRNFNGKYWEMRE